MVVVYAWVAPAALGTSKQHAEQVHGENIDTRHSLFGIYMWQSSELFGIYMWQSSELRRVSIALLERRKVALGDSLVVHEVHIERGITVNLHGPP